MISNDINTFTTDDKKKPLQRCKKCLQNGATFVAGATNVAGIKSTRAHTEGKICMGVFMIIDFHHDKIGI